MFENNFFYWINLLAARELRVKPASLGPENNRDDLVFLTVALFVTLGTPAVPNQAVTSSITTDCGGWFRFAAPFPGTAIMDATSGDWRPLVDGIGLVELNLLMLRDVRAIQDQVTVGGAGEWPGTPLIELFSRQLILDEVLGIEAVAQDVRVWCSDAPRGVRAIQDQVAMGGAAVAHVAQVTVVVLGVVTMWTDEGQLVKDEGCLGLSSRLPASACFEGFLEDFIENRR